MVETALAFRKPRLVLLLTALGSPAAACGGEALEADAAPGDGAAPEGDSGVEPDSGSDAGTDAAQPDACAPACSSGTVCCPEDLPCAGRCVPDCRLAPDRCPLEVPACDEGTGLCGPGEGNGVSSEELSVVNPTSGVEWWAKAFRPEDAGPDTRYPAIVAVPGGTGAGSESERIADPFRSPEAQAARGFVVVIFDADGRGNTGGQEDQCGHTHQDGLAALIESVAQLPYVDQDRIGVSTSSFGITMGSGVLARHPDLPVRFLLDVEGPADRNDTGHCDASDTGHIDHDCDDDVWWSEREALGFISRVLVPYLRLQHVRDHAQPDNAHAILMTNGATAVDLGGLGVSSWTRVNAAGDNEPNAVYSAESPPHYADDATEFDLPAFWTELFAL